VLHPSEIGGVFGTELLGEKKVANLARILEVQSVPVDDRVTPENEANGLKVGERELVEGLEPFGRIRFDQARSVV
jgi:hypothetical protein